MSDLTSKEKAVLDKTVELWNMLVSLPGEHADDPHEFRLYIHQIQEKILSRPARRTLKELQQK